MKKKPADAQHYDADDDGHASRAGHVQERAAMRTCPICLKSVKTTLGAGGAMLESHDNDAGQICDGSMFPVRKIS